MKNNSRGKEDAKLYFELRDITRFTKQSVNTRDQLIEASALHILSNKKVIPEKIPYILSRCDFSHVGLTRIGKPYKEDILAAIDEAIEFIPIEETIFPKFNIKRKPSTEERDEALDELRRVETFAFISKREDIIPQKMLSIYAKCKFSSIGFTEEGLPNKEEILNAIEEAIKEATGEGEGVLRNIKFTGVPK
jgi:hypothetical protein